MPYTRRTYSPRLGYGKAKTYYSNIIRTGAFGYFEKAKDPNTDDPVHVQRYAGITHDIHGRPVIAKGLATAREAATTAVDLKRAEQAKMTAPSGTTFTVKHGNVTIHRWSRHTRIR
jgi:hypothetical protein